MSIKLLPASVETHDLSPASPPQVPNSSTSLVPLTRRPITTRSAQIAVVPAVDIFARSSSSRPSRTTSISGTLVENSPADQSGPSAWEYVSGWAGSRSVEATAIDHYLSYAASFAGWSGRLLNLYA